MTGCSHCPYLIYRGLPAKFHDHDFDLLWSKGWDIRNRDILGLQRSKS